MIKKLLAAITVLSLLICTIHVGVLAFTDDADIQYSDAVSALTESGIIDGYPDGSFKPQENISRAEAAKMIAYFKLGSEAAEALEIPASQQFDDVPHSHWASKYIAWGVEEGIISGMGNGKYSPDDPVTAAQMAKLLLAACGFAGEYEGRDWEKNVAADASFIFSGDSEAIYAIPATREEVVLYMNNCMSYRDIKGDDGQAGGGPETEEAAAYQEKFAMFRQTVQTMVSGTENLSYSENGVLLTTVIDTPEHLNDIHSAIEWMYLSTFLNAIPDYASSLSGIVNISSTNAYAAALIAHKDDLNALLTNVTEIRVSGGGGSVSVASGERGTLRFLPGASGSPSQRAFEGFSSLLTNANLVTLGDYETESLTYQMIITLYAVMDDNSSCEINIPYTFCFTAA